jgi:HK97 family phage major capsid protein
MQTLTRQVPRQLTNVTVTWTDEATAKTVTKPTFGQLTQTAKKLAAVVQMTDELLQDNSVELDNFVKELIAEAMAIEEDRVCFAGNTGGGDPFNGVLYAAGVNTATMAGANLTADDIVDEIMSINAKYRTGATLVTSTTGLQLIMKLKDSQGRYLWQVPNGNQPPRIWTAPYEISDQIPTDLGTGTNETAILWGNWKKYLWISDRGGYEVVASNSAADFNGNKSAFMSDETWFRFKKRMSLDVALPQAFVKMQVK